MALRSPGPCRGGPPEQEGVESQSSNASSAATRRSGRAGLGHAAIVDEEECCAAVLPSVSGFGSLGVVAAGHGQAVACLFTARGKILTGCNI